MSADWTAAHVAAIADDSAAAPLIAAPDVARVTDDLDIWDAWPVQNPDGTPMVMGDGTQIWMALTAPRFADPNERHGHARIHLFHHRDGEWIAAGPAMPDGFSPGSREWSGSAIWDKGSGEVILYFTAAGRRGEASLSFEQRMFSARARLTPAGGLEDWRDLAEIVAPDPAHYMTTCTGGGIGTIKAFRDPAWFRDPADGRAYLLFAGSKAGSPSAYNGVVGIAIADGEGPHPWRIAPPLLSADGLNNELERPHIVAYAGAYYLFWSTQRHVFNPDGPTGPTGLYAMVAPALNGPWRPVNGTGLVFANPATAAAQAYSWMVLPDLRVTSFVDNWGDDGVDRFGGTFAPFLRLWIDGDRAGVAA